MVAGLLLLVFYLWNFTTLEAQIVITPNLDSFHNHPFDLPASTLLTIGHIATKLIFPKKHLSISAHPDEDLQGILVPSGQKSLFGLALPGLHAWLHFWSQSFPNPVSPLSYKHSMSISFCLWRPFLECPFLSLTYLISPFRSLLPFSDP